MAEQVAMSRYRLTAIWLSGILLIAAGYRELMATWPDTELWPLISSIAGVAVILFGMGWVDRLKTDRQRVAEILDSL